MYSSVGHGGASGYLALMSFYHFAPEQMRPAALLLNIVVSLIAWWQYSRTVDLKMKLFLWLIIGSIPTAFAGSLISIDAALYKQLLGILLIFPAARMFGFFKSSARTPNEPGMLTAILIGACIGFMSGLIGIGGGIILSPLLILLGWANVKQTALISALFIFVNSLSGIAGLVMNDAQFDTVLYLWIVVAILGGIAGAYIGSRKLAPVQLKRILGIVLLFAGLKLIFF